MVVDVVKNTIRISSGDSDFERRRSIRDACLNCHPGTRCALARAEWFPEIMSSCIVGRNATLFRQGEFAGKIYAIRNGWLQAVHLMPNGKAVSDLYGPGSLIGIECAVGQINYAFTAVALEECEVDEADAAEFLVRLQDDRFLAMDILRHVSLKIESLRKWYYATASKVPSSERLIQTLYEMSLNCSTAMEGGSVHINVPLPAQVLADCIGCSRQWASKLLTDFEKKGILRRNGVWITFSQHTLPRHFSKE